MVEALASGRPIIAYREGGAGEIVKPGVNGEFFNFQDVDSIAEAISNFKQKEYDSSVIKKSVDKFSDTRFQEEIISFIRKKLNL